jgi:hypothetical protein
LVAGDSLHQLVVAYLVAIAADHGGDLCVEQGFWDRAGLLDEDFDVLAGRVKNLGDPLVRHQGVEGRKVEAGERIDDGRLVRAGHLDQAELRPKRALAQELGVDGDESGARKPVAKGGEGGSIGDNRVFDSV